jgi:predicted ATPase
MRLKSLNISQYKNLKDFSLSFDGSSFIDVFVGKNGSGKSNLFEALIAIFQHLYEFDGTSSNITFSYTIKYEIDDKETKVAWDNDLGMLTINDKNHPGKSIGKTPLPDNVLVYYSGHNDTVNELVDQYEYKFSSRIKSADIKESRKFIGINSEYKSLLLSILLLQPDTNKARQYICTKLGIENIGIAKPGGAGLSEPVLKLLLVRPDYAKGASYNIENNDESDRYWKPLGITKEFLDRLSTCISRTPGGLTVTEGYFSQGDHYILYFDVAKVRQVFSDFSPQELFRHFDNLKTLGMLAEISIPLKLTSGLDAHVSHFSDGQFQSVYIYSIVELFKDRNCLTLLDEPDAFLHPEWQFGFLTQILDITQAEVSNNHVLMSSHSASTLCTLEEQSIRLFTIQDSKVSCSRRSKKEVINELSNSWIQYSEDESKLLIDNVIRSSSRPILFVEGISDVSILNTAYAKLYPGEDIPVLIQDAFDRGFIKVLLARDTLCNTYPDKQFFALFDFDDAYDDWRELGGEHQVTDISRGLCRKLPEKNVHSFLLPIPDNQLKAQVWDENNPIEKIIPKPHFCIEHIFWKPEVQEQWFKTDHKTGQIKFRGDKHKVKFAQEVVPKLDAASFEVFRPMFELIKSKCSIATT